MSVRFSVLALIVAAPVAAQQSSPGTIQVSGSGIVRTAPDVATLEFWLRGEGATSDDATRALAAKQRAVVGGVAGLLGPEAEVTTGNVTVIEVRGGQCNEAGGYGNRPQLSEGPCVVIGYLATLQGAARTSAVGRAGTAAGLASRLGASDARVQGFVLRDPAMASRQATAAALRDARTRAEAIATGAGVNLGSIVSVSDGNDGKGEIVVTGSRVAGPPPPPPPPEAPVALDTKPRPIETRAQVTVVYSIRP